MFFFTLLVSAYQSDSLSQDLPIAASVEKTTSRYMYKTQTASWILIPLAETTDP
jgi:hypothetical protein